MLLYVYIVYIYLYILKEHILQVIISVEYSARTSFKLEKGKTASLRFITELAGSIMKFVRTLVLLVQSSFISPVPV